MADFINLTCANCGGKLEIYNDMERFACGYCGREMVVQRRGGTVALKAVTEAIQRVQIGTDKTAAELAIPRLEKELEEARKRVVLREGAESTSGQRGCGGLALLAGFVLLIFQEWGYGFVALLVGGWLLSYFRSEEESTELKSLRKRVVDLETLIAEKKMIADG